MNEFPIRNVEINGIHLQICDNPTSIVTQDVTDCLKQDGYNLEKIAFKPGDVVIDIGANVGIVSIYIAKKYPQVKILAFEPVPDNFQNLLRNLQLNGVNNVVSHALAVTKDGRSFEMIAHLASNSGGATGYLRNMKLPGHSCFTVASTTLEAVFKKYTLPFVKLLKIDCEGGEHEILLNTQCLPKVEYLSGEFHINDYLQKQGYSNELLAAHCSRYISSEKLKFKAIRMAE